MVRTSVILTILTAIITSILYFFSVPVHESIPSAITYAALGDSIAEGVGATDHQGYTGLLKDYLKTRYQTVNYSNAALSGDTSTDLLTKLKTSSQVKQAVASADMITICIGGNNILRGIDSSLAGNMNALDSGVSTFAKDWPLILKTIRDLSPKSKIYAMTVYNPINTGDLYNSSFPITSQYYEIIDSYIRELNQIISGTDTGSKYNYKVVDAYTAFKASTDNSKPLHGFKKYSDPHPTDEGHKLISQLHIQALEQ